MNWILSNPELSAGILTSLVLLAALIFAYRQLRGMAKDRHAQILLALSAQWNSDTMQKARKASVKKFQEAQKLEFECPEAKLAEMMKESMEKEPEVVIEVMKVADFFEDLGLLVNKKMLHPPELALEVFAGSIIIYWERYEKYIDAMRQIHQRPDIYEWFEYLYRLSKAYSEAKLLYKGSPETRPSPTHLFGKLTSLFK